MCVVGPVGRRELAGAVEEKRGCPGRASHPRSTGGLLERNSDRFVRLCNGRGQVSPPRFRILHELGEARVYLRPAKWISRLVCTGREQWVREADPVSVELDDMSFEGRSQPGLARYTGRGLDEPDCRVRERGGREEVIAALRRQSLKAAMDEGVQRLRHRQGLARFDGDARRGACAQSGVRTTGSLRRPDAPRREEGAASGIPVLLDDAMQRTEVERAYLDVAEAFCGSERRSSSSRVLSSPVRRERSTPTCSARSLLAA